MEGFNPRSSMTGQMQTGDRPSQPLRRLREEPSEVVARIAGEIGPRAPASLGEAKTAAYLDGRLRRAGMQVTADTFQAPTTVGADGVFLAITVLLQLVLYRWLAGPSTALALANLTIAFVALNRHGTPILVRRRPSQNVVATRAATEHALHRVVLLAPLISPPLTHQTVRRLASRSYSTYGRLAATVLLSICAIVGLITRDQLWWYAQMLPAICIALMGVAECITAWARTSAGAISHAGALATLLSISEECGTLQYTEVWAVAVGGADAGLNDFLRRYPFDREETVFLALESIGGGELAYIVEDGWPRTRNADAALVATLDALPDHPLPRRFRDNTMIAGPLITAGFRAVAMMCLNHDAVVPLYGTSRDIPSAVSPDLLDRTTRIGITLLRTLDTNTKSS